MRSKITRVPSILLTLQPFLSFLPHKINYSWEGDCGGEISPEANEIIRNKDFTPTLQCTSSFSDEIQVVPHPHRPKPINDILDPSLYPLLFFSFFFFKKAFWRGYGTLYYLIFFTRNERRQAWFSGHCRSLMGMSSSVTGNPVSQLVLEELSTG